MRSGRVGVEGRNSVRSPLPAFGGAKAGWKVCVSSLGPDRGRDVDDPLLPVEFLARTIQIICPCSYFSFLASSAIRLSFARLFFPLINILFAHVVNDCATGCAAAAHGGCACMRPGPYLSGFNPVTTQEPRNSESLPAQCPTSHDERTMASTQNEKAIFWFS